MICRATPTALLLALSIFSRSHAQTTDGDVPGLMDDGGTSGNPAEYIIGQTADYSWAISDTSDFFAEIGDNNSYNQLTVQNGATADLETKNLQLGTAGLAAINSLIVTGSTTTVTNVGNLNIGSQGPDNSVTIESGASLSATNILLGVFATADRNSMTVTGNNSLASSAKLFVGRAGTDATLTISDGGTINTSDYAWLGNPTPSYSGVGGEANITVTGSSSSLNIGSYLTVGDNGGDGNGLSVMDGASLTAVGVIDYGLTSNSTLTIEGSGSVVSAFGMILGGVADTGNILTVSADSLFKNTDSSVFTITSGNTLRIDGGFIAWAGDHESDFASSISGSFIEISDGSGGWTIAGESYLSYDFFDGDDAAAEAFSGYSGLGGYTIISTVSAVPEPASFATLLGVGALLFAGRRRRTSHHTTK